MTYDASTVVAELVLLAAIILAPLLHRGSKS